MDNIPSCLASGEAVPKIFRQTDHECVGIVATMQRARAAEMISFPFEVMDQTLGGQHRCNGYHLFEVGKRHVGREHVPIPVVSRQCGPWEANDWMWFNGPGCGDRLV